MATLPMYEAYFADGVPSSRANANCRCVLIATGMGPMSWLRYGVNILPIISPDLLISFGFCGEIHTLSNLSRLYAPVIFRIPPLNTAIKSLPTLMAIPPIPTRQVLADHKTLISEVISTPIYIPKYSLPAIPYIVPTVVDMESYFMALTASIYRIPFLCIRAATDGPNDAIPFDVNRLLDNRGFVSMRRVLSVVAESPGLLHSFVRYFLRSRTAAYSLKKLLLDIIALPKPVLKSSAIPKPLVACHSKNLMG